MSHRPIPTPGAVTGTTSTDSPADWRHRAACLDADPELFFAVGDAVPEEQLREAAAYCNRCPVWDLCLKAAVATGVNYGVRAGRDMYQGQRPGRKRAADVAA